MAKFTTANGLTIHLNPYHAVFVQPALDPNTQKPLLGLVSIMLTLVPPNLPGVGHTSVNVKGTLEEIAEALGF